MHHAGSGDELTVPARPLFLDVPVAVLLRLLADAGRVGSIGCAETDVACGRADAGRRLL